MMDNRVAALFDADVLAEEHHVPIEIVHAWMDHVLKVFGDVVHQEVAILQRGPPNEGIASSYSRTLSCVEGRILERLGAR